MFSQRNVGKFFYEIFQCCLYVTSCTSFELISHLYQTLISHLYHTLISHLYHTLISHLYHTLTFMRLENQYLQLSTFISDWLVQTQY